ncbi:hypothetical protein ASALC70_00782 [Alcanivorax sp. ALC70]|nr:hypothetical protein ASALC70_00782 [Alcanivorax sp. ALC70]
MDITPPPPINPDRSGFSRETDVSARPSLFPNAFNAYNRSSACRGVNSSGSRSANAFSTALGAPNRSAWAGASGAGATVGRSPCSSSVSFCEARLITPAGTPASCATCNP